MRQIVEGRGGTTSTVILKAGQAKADTLRAKNPTLTKLEAAKLLPDGKEKSRYLGQFESWPNMVEKVGKADASAEMSRRGTTFLAELPRNNSM